MKNKALNLEAEEICGHNVTSETKRLWAVELDLLNQLKDLCEKYNINYIAGGGTLLGAIRHKGFIPWDDDIDVYMFPDDYKIFCEVAKKELKAPYFFQHYTTEQEFSPSIARIRRSDTTAMTQHEYDTVSPGYNCGIFIDIFPIQYVFENKFLLHMQKIMRFFLGAGIFGYKRSLMFNKYGDVSDKKIISRILVIYWYILKSFITYEQLCKYYFKVCSLCRCSKNIGLIAFLGYKKKYIWKTKWWRNAIEVPFENTTIKVPKGYDEILKNQFGNYWVFEKGTAIHTIKCFDTEVSYKDKLHL